MRSRTGSNLRTFDISVILPIHEEASYLARTFASLEDSVDFAVRRGIRIECVCVLDRPDDPTRRWIESYSFSKFSSHTVIEVGYGSSGLARNAGIKAATGEFISLHDSDDLISTNYLSAGYADLVKSDGKTIHFAEYVVKFGLNHEICKFVGSDYIHPVTLLHWHSFTSTLLTHHSAFDEISYEDVRVGSGYAFEDWALTNLAVAKNFRMEIVKDTVLFYRQRQKSVFRRSEALSVMVPPAGLFHKPDVYTRLYERPETATPDQAGTEHLGAIRKFVTAANRIDHSIDPERIFNRIHTNHKPVESVCTAYYHACQFVKGLSFDHVFLVPYFIAGGAEKYILSLINSLVSIKPSARILLLSGHKCNHHQWIERLPAQAMFLDVASLTPDISDDDIDTVTLRIIESTAERAPIYLKVCEYSHRFFEKYYNVLTPNHNVYYMYFSDQYYVFDKKLVSRGYCFEFVSRYGKNFKGILTDNDTMKTKELRYLDEFHSKFIPLYVPTEVKSEGRQINVAPRRRRLLWASRLDMQKRPDILAAVARSLAEQIPDVAIDVYGTGPSSILKFITGNTPRSLRYLGPYANFSDLPLQEFDALLYTSDYDGLPNVIIEALAAGLPVIAPDVGAISEAVTSRTGFLVERSVDEEQWVQNYVNAIKKFYSYSDEELRRVSGCGRDLIAMRHSEARLVTDVRRFISDSNVELSSDAGVVLGTAPISQSMAQTGDTQHDQTRVLEEMILAERRMTSFYRNRFVPLQGPQAADKPTIRKTKREKRSLSTKEQVDAAVTQVDRKTYETKSSKKVASKVDSRGNARAKRSLISRLRRGVSLDLRYYLSRFSPSCFGKVVMDLGVHDGSDAEYYLSKGFLVVGLEPNPERCLKTRRALDSYAATGHFRLLNRGIWWTNKLMPFYIDQDDECRSSFFEPKIGAAAKYSKVVQVPCETIDQLFRRYGIPYYLKIDVEGAERWVIRALVGEPKRPQFVSVEEYGIECFDDLRDAGYVRFQIVPQQDKSRVMAPFPPREGKYKPRPFTSNSSGLFGLELPEAWLSYDEVRRSYLATVRDETGKSLAPAGEWFDIHARVD